MNLFRDNRPEVIVALLLIINCLIWYALSFEHPDELKVSFLDIGQGDSVFIESPTGNQLLIDAGPSSAVLRKLGQELPFYDRSIDVVIGTHPDKDHIGGIPDVLNNYSVGLFMEPFIDSKTNIDDAMREIIAVKGVERIEAKRGQALNLGGGVKLFILYPDRDPKDMETNDASVVAKLVYGETSFLFTGDSPIRVEEHLGQSDGLGLDSDVLKIGHHGSRTSTSAGFVSLVSPHHAVISAGEDNSYGHPHKEVIDVLTSASTTIEETSKEGTITFVSNGRTIVKK